MANLVQTAANVGVGQTARVQVLQAGEALTEGQPFYLNDDGKYYRADANTSAATAVARGIVLTPASTNGYFVGALGGEVNLGATLVKGETYVVSATTGAICPVADLVANDYVTYLGTAKSTSLLELKIDATGIQK